MRGDCTLRPILWEGGREGGGGGSSPLLFLVRNLDSKSICHSYIYIYIYFTLSNDYYFFQSLRRDWHLHFTRGELCRSRSARDGGGGGGSQADNRLE